MKKKPPPNTKKDKLECPVCKRMEFVTEDDLILHLVNYHKLVNSLKHDLSITKTAKSKQYTIKCDKCSQIFQNDDNFFIHLFKNHLKEVLKTIEGSRLKANSSNIKILFESLQVKQSQSSIAIINEETNSQDIGYILSIEYWGTAQISNQVDSEVQTDQSSISQLKKTKQFKQQNDSSNVTSKEEKYEKDVHSSNAAIKIYNIDSADNDDNSNLLNNKSSTVDATIDFNDDDDSDDEYLSFIASTIDVNNVRLDDGRIATQTEEKKKDKKKFPAVAKKKEEERNFFDKLEQVTDMLILQKTIINNQTQHKCLKCNLDFDNEFMLMKHIWDYHSEDNFFLY